MADRKKTILVTGGAGFIGSRLCARLLGEGNRVISLDNYFSGSKKSHIEGVEYREGDTKDIASLVPEAGVELVYHLGEYARVEVSLSEPDVVWESNVAGTFRVLEYWRKRNVAGDTCKLVYAGSSTKFGDGGLGRNMSPYAWTKATNTELVRNYGAWYGLPYAVTYFYNVYGPGERADKYGTVVEIFRQKCLKGETLGVVSPGTQKRNFTHVDDIVDGLILVGEKGEGDDFGLGNKNTYTILELAKMFGRPVEMLPERAGNRMQASVETFKSEALGWSPKRELSDYIRDITSK